MDLLSERGGWLLIYDNAGSDEDLAGLTPSSPTGTVVITSRNPAFERTAAPVAVTPFPRTQSAR